MSLSVISRCLARLHRPRVRRGARVSALVGMGALLWLPLATRANAPGEELPLRVMIVGGGPNLLNNQVAIESNVRYVGKLLPPNTPRTTLFADGDPNHATVLYDDDLRALPIGEQILSLINPNGNDEGSLRYRKPNLGVKLDGASRQDDINRAFGQLAQSESADPGGHQLLLYFTGHGSPGRQNNFENNMYDLWEGGRNGPQNERAALTVRDLSRQIARLPNDVPVTVVMVQCFSGAFANLIFDNGDPRGDLAKRDICGFYATVDSRVAAGCTSAVNEAEYRDFTSFFFSALTGRDRVGRRVTGADYNGDGRVGMDEAYCYTLIHDDSIDVPVCTSDAFLRRFVDRRDGDREIFQTSYRDARQWASLPQRAALDALSDKLRLGGNSRLSAAYEQFLAVQNQAGQNRRQMGDYRTARDRFRAIQGDSKSALLRQFPNLKLSDSAARREARQAAITQLTREADQGKWKDLLDADAAVDKAERSMEDQEIAGSQIIRFVRLAKSVILAHRLRESNDAGLKERYARLIAAESRTLLPPADALNKDTALVK